MKYRSLLPALIIALSFTVPSFAEKPKSSQDELAKQAKVTKEEAAKTALVKVPNGVIKESELEKEHGKLVWSFDITSPGTKDITEVQVDAISGAVVSVEKESPENEGKEKHTEHK